jgi:hypothetical protein
MTGLGALERLQRAAIVVRALQHAEAFGNENDFRAWRWARRYFGERVVDRRMQQLDGCARKQRPRRQQLDVHGRCNR